MERYLTVPQVAELLQLSEKRVYRLAPGSALPREVIP
jgi:predicted DNA-binding transcriptional regulator AlpA